MAAGFDLTKPITVRGRTFKMDDFRDPAILWDLTDERNPIKAAEFHAFGSSTTVDAIMDAIEDYLGRK